MYAYTYAYTIHTIDKKNKIKIMYLNFMISEKYIFKSGFPFLIIVLTLTFESFLCTVRDNVMIKI